EANLFPFLAVLADMVGYDFGPDSDWLAVYEAVYSDPDASDGHWVEYRIEGKRAVDLSFAREPGSGVVAYRPAAEPEVEFAAEWLDHMPRRWTVTQDGRLLGRDGKPCAPSDRHHVHANSLRDLGYYLREEGERASREARTAGPAER